MFYKFSSINLIWILRDFLEQLAHLEHVPIPSSSFTSFIIYFIFITFKLGNVQKIWIIIMNYCLKVIIKKVMWSTMVHYLLHQNDSLETIITFLMIISLVKKFRWNYSTFWNISKVSSEIAGNVLKLYWKWIENRNFSANILKYHWNSTEISLKFLLKFVWKFCWNFSEILSKMNFSAKNRWN